MRCVQVFCLMILSFGLSVVSPAAPSLLYSTMVADSLNYSVGVKYAIDIDSEGNLFFAVPHFIADEGRCVRIFRVDATGGKVSILIDLFGEYYTCQKITCGATGVYLLINGFNLVKITYDGQEAFNLYPTPLANVYDVFSFFIDVDDNLYYTFNIRTDEGAALIPVTEDALDSDYNGDWDAVIQKYDSGGNLLYCSFLGGIGSDFIQGSRIDSEGNWNLYFSDSSNDFPYPITGDPYTHDGPCIVIIPPGFEDIHGYYSMTSFIRNVRYFDNHIYQFKDDKLLKFSNTGELIWSMKVFEEIPRFGSDDYNGSYQDCAFDIDGENQIYFVRHVSWGSPFTVTPDAYNDTVRGGDSDLGIWKISDNAELQYGTYLGGVDEEITAMNAVVFYDGKLYVAGYTKSHDFPLTPGAFIDTRTPPTPGQAQHWGLFAFCIDFNETTEVSDESSAIPEALILDPPHPNPFNPATTISFTLPEAGFARLAVYNISGQLVRELTAENLPAGRHEIVWDGRDMNGAQVSSGVYIARLAAGERTAVRKVTLVR